MSVFINFNPELNYILASSGRDKWHGVESPEIFSRKLHVEELKYSSFLGSRCLGGSCALWSHSKFEITSTRNYQSVTSSSRAIPFQPKNVSNSQFISSPKSVTTPKNIHFKISKYFLKSASKLLRVLIIRASWRSDAFWGPKGCEICGKLTCRRDASVANSYTF